MLNKSFYIGLVAISVLILITVGVFQIYQRRISQNGVEIIPSSQEAQKTDFGSLNNQSTPSPAILGTNDNAPQVQPESGSNTLNIQNPGITVTNPVPNSKITSPLTVNGQANVLGNNVYIEVKDSNGNVLAKGSAVACFGYNSCPFETSVAFKKPQTPNGTVEVYSLSTYDNSKKDLHIISVTF